MWEKICLQVLSKKAESRAKAAFFKQTSASRSPAVKISSWLLKQFQSGVSRNSADFDVHRPTSDVLNSTCCISKSSISILLKRSRSNWIVVISNKSGLMRYENIGPWIWKSWLRLTNCALRASKLELEHAAEALLSAL